MTNEQLKQALEEKEASCILFQDDEILMTSYEKGVLPLWRFIRENQVLPQGKLEVADKMVGRGVAYLLIHLGVNHVYTKIISQTALDVLKNYPITVKYNELVPYILNRTQDGQCPMEQALAEVEGEREGIDVVDTFVKRRLGLIK